MDKRIGILHLSDIHACEGSRATIHRLVELLGADLTILRDKYDVEIKLVCISGDVINSGDNADQEFLLVLEELLQPLMKILSLDEKSFFIVAGNHEVKRKSIISYVETGLEKELESEQKIDEFISNIYPESLQRIQYFDNQFATLFGERLVWSSPLTRAYHLELGPLTIGISCVNSAWRSTGIGIAEKQKLIVGRKQIIDSFEQLQTCDIKICMMHHPLDWLVDDDKSAVEKCINQFDIVLTGHIHESDTKLYTSFNGQTLFNTCGKFDNSSDIYNGYTVLSINPYNKDCDAILRQYIPHPRNCFEAALSVTSEGVFSTTLGKKNDYLALAYNITHSINSNFLDFANSYFVSNVSAGKIIKDFDSSFISPEFSRYSEYEKETRFDTINEKDEEPVSLNYICNSDHNILLLGKKEIGKTTTLHYIAKYCLSNFNTLKKVPIIINMSRIDYSGKNIILRAAHKFVSEFCSSSDSFSVRDIEKLLASGACTIMFDNFESVREEQLKKINEFIALFPDNKLIFSEKEEIGARCLRDAQVVPNCKYETIHIRPLTKNQIRTIATQNVPSSESSILVDKIMLCFKNTTLPKTPFVLSLIISLCNTPDFTPINEAVVMEQFLETLLEKTSPAEVFSTTFDFRAKEDFLIYIVSYMNEQNKFYVSNQEFDTLIYNYHSKIGFPVTETGFDTIFIRKGILIRTDQMVTFRYNCIIEYYLAKKAEISPDFLSYILKEENYLNYSDALLYYTGLNRRSIQVVNALQNNLHHDFELFNTVVSELKNYDIGMNIAIPENSFQQKLNQGKLSQAQSDQLQDLRDTSEDKLPENMNKQATHMEMDAFVQRLAIYGTCLKNLEFIDKEEKEKIYTDYISGLCIMLGILIKQTEISFETTISDMKKLPEKFSESDIIKLQSQLKDIIKLTLPIAIQNIALDNIGTSKLRSIIESNIRSGNASEFSQFFSVFLYSDLRLPGFKAILKTYISEAENKSLLKIIFFKLMYYYCFRYFDSSLDSFLENTLADINIKLNGSNKFGKDKIIKNIKEQKRFSDT